MRDRFECDTIVRASQNFLARLRFEREIGLCSTPVLPVNLDACARPALKLIERRARNRARGALEALQREMYVHCCEFFDNLQNSRDRRLALICARSAHSRNRKCGDHLGRQLEKVIDERVAFICDFADNAIPSVKARHAAKLDNRAGRSKELKSRRASAIEVESGLQTERLTSCWRSINSSPSPTVERNSAAVAPVRLANCSARLTTYVVGRSGDLVSIASLASSSMQCGKRARELPQALRCCV